MGGHLCGVLLPENGRRSFVNHWLGAAIKTTRRRRTSSERPPFELSRKRIAARMRTCQCMSHFVYNLRSRPLVRDLAARVHGQIASDHCRSDLITGLPHWARAGYPFPEVNLPEYSTVRFRNLQDLLVRITFTCTVIALFSCQCHVLSLVPSLCTGTALSLCCLLLLFLLSSSSSPSSSVPPFEIQPL